MFGWLHAGTVFCVWEHSAEGDKALERDRKARQKQEEVWDNLKRATNVNLMATALQYSYANLSLLFARYHAKIIPCGATKARNL